VNWYLMLVSVDTVEMLHGCLDDSRKLAGSPMTGQLLTAASCTVTAVFVICKS